MNIYNKDLVGKEVVSSDAWMVGTVRSVVVDESSWAVTSLDIARASEEDVRRGVAAVPEKLGGVTDRVTSKLGVGTVSDKIGAGPADASRPGFPITIDSIEGVDDKVVLKIPQRQLATSSARLLQQQSPETQPQLPPPGPSTAPSVPSQPSTSEPIVTGQTP